MKKPFQRNLKLGIIKGGQLGRMMIQEMLNYDVQSFILDDDPFSPCKDCCTDFTEGKSEDFETVYKFGKKVDVLTIEFENVNVEALEKLEQEGLPVFPSPKILKIIQDKGLQKKFYQDHAIPTADFVIIENRAEIQNHLDFLPAVQKTRKAGYDGKGVYKIHDQNDLREAFDMPSVLEKKIPFEKEISVVLARSSSGEIAIFPVVELWFNPEKNLVESLFAPANINKETEQKALEIAKKIAETLEMVGLLAVEMFVLKDGEVLVNEIAPRTHNSGHHTIEANFTSQFEQHLRAILDFPLGSTTMVMPSVMINLLGEDGFSGEAKYEGIEKVMAMEGTFIHLYGKKITKPFRKMGHVTILDSDIKKAQQKAELIQKTLKVIS